MHPSPKSLTKDSNTAVPWLPKEAASPRVWKQTCQIKATFFRVRQSLGIRDVLFSHCCIDVWASHFNQCLDEVTSILLFILHLVGLWISGYLVGSVHLHISNIHHHSMRHHLVRASIPHRYITACSLNTHNNKMSHQCSSFMSVQFHVPVITKCLITVFLHPCNFNTSHHKVPHQSFWVNVKFQHIMKCCTVPYTCMSSLCQGVLPPTGKGYKIWNEGITWSVHYNPVSYTHLTLPTRRTV